MNAKNKLTVLLMFAVLAGPLVVGLGRHGARLLPWIADVCRSEPVLEAVGRALEAATGGMLLGLLVGVVGSLRTQANPVRVGDIVFGGVRHSLREVVFGVLGALTGLGVCRWLGWC